MKSYDVAVVGAGPAGCSAAITLAQRGYTVALIDRALFPRDKLCGDFVNPINWPVLQSLNVGADLLRCRHAKVAKLRLTAANGTESTSPLAAEGERRFGLGVRRYHLDHTLVTRAKNLGVTVKEGTRLRALEKISPGWNLSIDGPDDLRSLEAKFLVGADGRNSTVARYLGLTPRPERRPLTASLGFEIELAGVPGVDGSVEIHQFAGGYAGLVRVDDDTVNLCFTVRKASLAGPVSYTNLHRGFLGGNPFLRELLAGADPVSELRSVWPVYFPARPRCGRGFIMVGDAARVTEPVTGEGIFLALRSGQLGAAAIAAALQQNDGDPKFLSRYDLACRAEFGMRLRINNLLRVLVQRDKLMPLLIRFLGERSCLLHRLVNTVCLHRSVGTMV